MPLRTPQKNPHERKPHDTTARNGRVEVVHTITREIASKNAKAAAAWAVRS